MSKVLSISVKNLLMDISVHGQKSMMQILPNSGICLLTIFVKISIIYDIVLNIPLPASIYLLKVNNRNNRKRCKICSTLTIKTPERRQWPRYDVFMVNTSCSSVFLLLILKM